ncbi:hypothetical protein RR46_08295 [Papilio xuthus]|uniref:Uncharacterized protein n=1 Tax=Papilio xuthus TaxID=66420 RepID=A0A194PGN1_PAPXU|nr:hypothetical protein RR46_08295 [Papilio xuthus]
MTDLTFILAVNRRTFRTLAESTMRTRLPRCRPLSTRILVIFLLLLALALYCIYYNATPSGYKPRNIPAVECVRLSRENAEAPPLRGLMETGLASSSLK